MSSQVTGAKPSYVLSCVDGAGRIDPKYDAIIPVGVFLELGSVDAVRWDGGVICFHMAVTLWTS